MITEVEIINLPDEQSPYDSFLGELPVTDGGLIDDLRRDISVARPYKLIP